MDRLFYRSDTTFSYLDKLIHSGVNEMVLKSDITLAKGEEEKYPDGIRLDVEDLVIDGAGHAIDGCGMVRIFENTAKNVTIKNVTLKNGYSKNPGGAICNEGDLRIIDSMLQDNTSDSFGGALSNGGYLLVEDCRFVKNAAECGGAIGNDSAHLWVRSCSFCSNRSTLGGAISNDYGEVKVDYSGFDKNTAAKGGAIANRGHYPRIPSRQGVSKKFIETFDIPQNDDSDGNLKVCWSGFLQNTSDDGGAIANENGMLSISSCRFSNNSCRCRGGAILSEGDDLVMSRCELNENASNCGGAIYYCGYKLNQGLLKIDGCAISKNSAKRAGGGVYLEYGYPDIHWSKIDENLPDDVFEQDSGDLEG